MSHIFASSVSGAGVKDALQSDTATIPEPSRSRLAPIDQPPHGTNNGLGGRFVMNDVARRCATRNDKEGVHTHSGTELLKTPQSDTRRHRSSLIEELGLRRRRWRTYPLLGLVAAALAAPLPGFAAGNTTRVSVASDGMQANDQSYISAISADGRYVAFFSYADNLVPGDTNGVPDVFIRDRISGKTTRVSIASTGTQGNGFSVISAISADGRYVVYFSHADNLVQGDTNQEGDVFVHDRKTAQTFRVNIGSDGVQANGVSLRWAAISADGRYVAFSSWAENLVSGDGNGYPDTFVHDRKSGQTTRVSIASDGTEANSHSYAHAISADGRYVAFTSWANNLVSGDTNEKGDVFVHDRKNGQTTRISVASNGAEGKDGSNDPVISADGRYVAFYSHADNLVPGDTNALVDTFVHDRKTRRTTRVSVASNGTQAKSDSYFAEISADGRYVGFYSDANDLVPGDSNDTFDAFIHDRKTGQTIRVSVASDGTQANYNSEEPSISADGRFVTFSSYARNLVPGDTNGSGDIFIRDRLLLTGKKADISVTQTESGDPVAKGSLLSYTVTVRNNGLDAAAGVNLTDLVPLNAQLLSVVPSQGSCYPAPITVCRLGTLAPGAHAKVRVNLTANQKSILRNTVSVNAAPRDLAQDNNRSTISTRAR